MIIVNNGYICKFKFCKEKKEARLFHSLVQTEQGLTYGHLSGKLKYVEPKPGTKDEQGWEPAWENRPPHGMCHLQIEEVADVAVDNIAITLHSPPVAYL